MKKNVAKCTGSTEGIIEQSVVKGQDFPTMLVVRYTVGGNNFELKESIKLKSEKIKLGFLTVGQKRVPALGNTSVGSKVRVMYDPNDPNVAYLPDNMGKANV